MYIKSSKNCTDCGCGLHPELNICSFCSAQQEMANEAGLTSCPFCNGKGKLDPYYNIITQEADEDICPACDGKKYCSIKLAEEIKERDRISKIYQSKELPF